MVGALMFVTKILMSWIPNVHILGPIIMTLTIVYRQKALYPLYLYVFVDGLFGGFALWWYPYLYIWTVLWAITMLLPRRMPTKAKCVVYPTVCCLHGIAFGTLYAPAHAIMLGMNVPQMLAWIVAGLPWDLLHGVGNLFAGMLILPLSELLQKCIKRQRNP